MLCNINRTLSLLQVLEKLHELHKHIICRDNIFSYVLQGNFIYEIFLLTQDMVQCLV